MNKKARLRSKADRLCYEIIKEKYPMCEIRGCHNPTDKAHHFYFKSNFGHLRYDLDNLIGLCRQHHFVLHHQDPKKIEKLIIDKRGKKWHNELQKKAFKPDQNYQTTIKYYEDIIKCLNQLNN